MFFVILSLFAFWQTFGVQAATPFLPPLTNPSLQRAASLLQSFQNQTHASEDKKDRLLPAQLTKNLYDAGKIITGQGGVRFDTDPHRFANAQEKKLYLTIAFTMGIDLAARWQSVLCHDIAAYFEKSFGFKEGYLLHLQPEVLQSNRPQQHCFFMTLGALAGYQSVTGTLLSQTFTNGQAHYVSLKNVILGNRAWLEVLLDSIQKENHALYPALVKIYAQKSNQYYFLKEEGGGKSLEISPKPLHFSRITPLVLTPLNSTHANQLKSLINECYLSSCLITEISSKSITDFADKLRGYGFIPTSLEEVQNILIVLWSYHTEPVMDILHRGLDQDLYEAFSKDREIYGSHPIDYSGVTVILNDTKPRISDDEDEKDKDKGDPLLFLQLAGGGSNFIDNF